MRNIAFYIEDKNETSGQTKTIFIFKILNWNELAKTQNCFYCPERCLYAGTKYFECVKTPNVRKLLFGKDVKCHFYMERKSINKNVNTSKAEGLGDFFGKVGKASAIDG